MQSKSVTIVSAMFLVTAALVFSPAVCAGLEIAHANYLPSWKLDTQFSIDLAKLLNKDTRPAGLDPQKMFEEFAEVKREENIETNEQYIYRDMYDIGTTSSSERCIKPYQLRLVYRIISLARQYPNMPALANWMNYLKTMGKEKFAQCAADVGAQFEAKKLPPKGLRNAPIVNPISYEKFFDKVIAAAYELETDTRDNDLYGLAKRADMAKDQVNVRRMMKVVHEAEPMLPKEKLRDSMETLRSFIEDKCFVLQLVYEDDFGYYNTAIAFGLQPPRMSLRFLKLNEYNRICLAWFNDPKVKENILEQLQASVGDTTQRWYKFGKN